MQISACKSKFSHDVTQRNSPKTLNRSTRAISRTMSTSASAGKIGSPLDAGKLTNSSRSLRTSDIVSILVNIYESKDLFVQEYRRLLAQKFLSTFEWNQENERRYLELLTLRFGGSVLDACEVMLRDMNLSKKPGTRINLGEISKFYFETFPIKCLTVSLNFWQNKGILKEAKNDVFTLVDDESSSDSSKMDTDLKCNTWEEMLDIDDDDDKI